MTTYSEPALRALAMFGLTVHDLGLDAAHRARARAKARRAAERLDRALDPGRIALITGPSGAGKSTLLGALAELIRRRRADERLVLAPDPADLGPPDTRVIDAIARRATGGGRSLGPALRILGWCGLGDARLIVTPIGALSAGQRARLALALALRQADASPRAFILADEFAASLDAVTGAAVAAGFSRAVRESDGRIRAAIATHHGPAMAELNPAVRVRIPSAWLAA